MSEELRKKFWCDIIISFIKSRKSEIGYSSETCEPYIEIADILLDEFDKRFEKVEDYDPLSCGLDGMFGRYISKGLSEIGIKTRRELFEFIRSRTEKKLPKDVFWEIKDSEISGVRHLGNMKLMNIATWYAETLECESR